MTAQQLAVALLVLALISCSASRLTAPIHNTNSRVPGDEEPDRVLSMPGYRGQLKSKHYAGYIPVSAHKKLFYYFVESERTPSVDPVVLWLNGGPGCSSFDGFVYEMGPFLFSKTASVTGLPAVELSDNPYAWNKVANMIYLDSPAGVGLSYSSNPSDYITGDNQTAADAETFLRRFFFKFPAYQANPFFISGESYAGVYVPNLARAVVEGNEAGHQPYIDLKGYLVGNGVTDEQIDNDAFPSFAVGKSLISRKLYRELEGVCGGAYWNRSGGTECDRLYNSMSEELSELNIYDVLEDCYRGPNPDAAAAVRLQHAAAVRRLGSRWPLPGAGSRVGETHNYAHLGLTPPCTDSRLAAAWLNNNAVRCALHAIPLDARDSAGGGAQWQLCSDRILYTREIRSMIPIHLKLTGHYGLHALIYSGDHDMAVPHTGSERWTQELGLTVRHDWGPWYDGEYQVAGYFTEYERLTYASVKGAGHMVPENKPRQSLAMFERFIMKKTLRLAASKSQHLLGDVALHSQ